MAETRPTSTTGPNAATTAHRIPRPGIVERVHRGGPLCLVAAPPGYGKSALAQTLKDACEDSELVTPENYGETNGSAGERAWILVDDVDQLANGQVKSLSEWINKSGKSRVVLFSRLPIPETLERCLEGHEVHRLGPDRLRFERDETRRFLQERVTGTLAEDTISEVHEVTAGWPALLELLIGEASSAQALMEALRQRHPPAPVTRWIASLVSEETSNERREEIARCTVYRRIDPLRISAVLGGDNTRAGRLLEWFTERGLTSVRGDELRLRAPLLREGLRALFESESPDSIRDAEFAAATHLLEFSPEESAPDIVAHFLAAGEARLALSHLELHADRLLEQVTAEKLLTWLNALEDYCGDLPFSASALYSRVLAATGNWNEARHRLRECEKMLKSSTVNDPMTRTLGYARIASVRAHMAWLRGRSNEANTYCQRAMMAIKQALRGRSEQPSDNAEGMRFDLLGLQALLLLEAGRAKQAREVLSKIVEAAEQSLRRRTQAIALKDLAALMMREGDVRAAATLFDRALTLVNRRRLPDLYAQLHTFAAHNRLLSGEIAIARHHINLALSVRRSVGPDRVAESLLTAAGIETFEEKLDLAATQFEKALACAQQSANMKLRVEVLTHYALFTSRHGSIPAARERIELVKSLVGDLERSAPRLAALIRIAKGSVALSEQRYLESLNIMSQARDAFERLGYPYHHSLVLLQLAEIERAYAHSRQKAPRPEFRTYVEQGCQLAGEYGFDFGQISRFGPVFEDAAQLGSFAAGQHLRRLRGEVLIEENSAHLAGAESHGLLRLLSPEGERLVPKDSLSEITSAINRNHLNIFKLPEHSEIVHRGKSHSGNLKRVILPLLRTLLASPGEHVLAPKLAAAVWGEGEYDQRARTRLKVAISRLRDLLGPDAKHIRTIPGTGPRRSASTAYMVDKNLPFLWVEEVNEQN